MYPEYSISHPKETLYDLLQRAGGFTNNAYPEASYIIRQGKEIKIDLRKVSKRRKSKLNLTLIQGDRIIVNKDLGIKKFLRSAFSRFL